MQKRSGKTRTFSVSVDEKTRRLLKAEAARHFDGNVSAVITDLAKEIERRSAVERVLESIHAPPLTDERRAEIDVELGWVPRVSKPKKKSRRGEAA